MHVTIGNRRFLSWYWLLVTLTANNHHHVHAFAASSGRGALVKNASTYLSDLLSSPDRFAAALNMTVEEVAQTKQAHEDICQELHSKLASNDLTGPEKHALMCQHRLIHGRNPFVCQKCWSYLPICICHVAAKHEKIVLPSDKLTVVVWTHHREWGLTSNTGGLLGLTLQNCHVLMKGLPEHDEQLRMYIKDPNVTVAVLWPDQDNHGEAAPSNYMSLDEIQQDLNEKRYVLVAVDGTWRNARRMVARLPKDKVYFTDLSADVLDDILEKRQNVDVLSASGDISQSLLAPLRGRGANVPNDQVCTAEAVAGALIQLGIPRTQASTILALARQKVDLVCRYRAKIPRQYDVKEG